MPNPPRRRSKPKSPPPRAATPWSGLRLRALVLAAGLGTRLRPLTLQLPKPLLPVLGEPLLAHTLRRLAALGCEATAINLHHLGEQIRASFGEAFEGMPLVYSEEPEPLGTLGAIPPLQEFLAQADLVLLVNGDSLCRWPLDRLLRHHLEAGPEATLLLASHPDPADFGGGVAIDRAGSILAFRGSDPASSGAAHRYTFAGAHVFQPKLVAGVEPGFADIVRDLYEPALKAGRRLDAIVTSRPWYDLGTPGRYLEANLEWARAARRKPAGVLYQGPGVVIGPGARVDGAVLEAGVEIEAGATIEDSLILAGARIGHGSHLRSALIGPGAVVPPDTVIERDLVVAAVEGVPPSLA